MKSLDHLLHSVVVLHSVTYLTVVIHFVVGGLLFCLFRPCECPLLTILETQVFQLNLLPSHRWLKNQGKFWNQMWGISCFLEVFLPCQVRYAITSFFGLTTQSYQGLKVADLMMVQMFFHHSVDGHVSANSLRLCFFAELFYPLLVQPGEAVPRRTGDLIGWGAEVCKGGSWFRL